MSKVYVAADPHFGHAGVRNFPPRDEWAGNMTMEQHDEMLVTQWNAVVTKRDKVYLLGDVGMDRPMGYVTQGIIPRLLGTITVVGGNHDTAEILTHFNKTAGAISKSVLNKRIIMTHIPIHPQEMRWDYNIHGHLHGNVVRKEARIYQHANVGTPDPRYICVSMEHIDYTPKLLEQVVQEAIDA